MFFYYRVILYVLLMFFTSCQSVGIGNMNLAKKEVSYITLKQDSSDSGFINSKDVILGFFHN